MSGKMRTRRKVPGSIRGRRTRVADSGRLAPPAQLSAVGPDPPPGAAISAIGTAASAALHDSPLPSSSEDDEPTVDWPVFQTLHLYTALALLRRVSTTLERFDGRATESFESYENQQNVCKILLKF